MSDPTPTTRLPDDAIVIRGGQNLPESFAAGSGVTIDDTGLLDDVSVNAAAGVTPSDLTAADSGSGYPGIPHKQVGMTTVGAIRAAGGDVVPTPRRHNPYHATLKGLTPEQASVLFRPTVRNPSRDQPN